MQDFVLDVQVKVIAKPVNPKTGTQKRGPYERNMFVITDSSKAKYVGAKTDIATLAANAAKVLNRQWALSSNDPAQVRAFTPTTFAATTATFIGQVHSHGVSTVVTFEYGTTKDLGTSVAAAESPSTTDSWIDVSKDVTGLTAGTQYYYRVKGVSGGVTVYSELRTFITPSS